jgi:hypothetical protein
LWVNFFNIFFIIIGHGPIIGRLLFLIQPKTIIDIFSIGPSIATIIYAAYVFFLVNSTSLALDSPVFRGLQVLRLLRVFKLTRDSRFFRVLAQIALRKHSELLNVLVSLCIIVVMFSSLMSWIEGDLQPNYFGSIPRSLYYCLITMLTVGFGDVSAQTVSGKAITVLFGLCGIVIFAIMTSLFGTAYIEQMQIDRREFKEILKRQRKKNVQKHIQLHNMFLNNRHTIDMVFPSLAPVNSVKKIGFSSTTLFDDMLSIKSEEEEVHDNSLQKEEESTKPPSPEEENLQQ